MSTQRDDAGAAGEAQESGGGLTLSLYIYHAARTRTSGTVQYTVGLSTTDDRGRAVEQRVAAFQFQFTTQDEAVGRQFFGRDGSVVPVSFGTPTEYAAPAAGGNTAT